MSPVEAGLPERAAVVVVGGGIVGLCAALTLASWSVPVVLCEKGSLGGEQSVVGRGWIRKQGMQPCALPLMRESERLWRDYARRLDPGPGLRQTGSTRLFLDARSEQEGGRWLARTAGQETGSRRLSERELTAWLGSAGGRVAGAVFTSTDCQADPAVALSALAGEARRLGARLFERTAVRGLLQRSGRIEGVLTEHGPIACPSVIVAAGVWSALLLAGTGLPPLPVIPVRSSWLRTAPAPMIASGMVEVDGVCLGRLDDGGYTVTGSRTDVLELGLPALRHLPRFLPAWRQLGWGLGPAAFAAPAWPPRPSGRSRAFETQRTLWRSPDRARLQTVWAIAQRHFPALEGVEVVSMQGGLMDLTPDALPVIDAPRAPAGLVLATGLSGQGFALGPGVGLLAAQLATARRPVVDPGPFSLARFTPQGRPRGRVAAR